MKVYDRNATSDVTCEVFGMDANGASAYHETLTSSGSGSGSQTIPNNMTIPSTVLFYSAYCTVPPDKGTGQSFVTEFIVD
jgi:hypothetical protein